MKKVKLPDHVGFDGRGFFNKVSKENEQLRSALEEAKAIFEIARTGVSIKWRAFKYLERHAHLFEGDKGK